MIIINADGQTRDDLRGDNDAATVVLGIHWLEGPSGNVDRRKLCLRTANRKKRIVLSSAAKQVECCRGDETLRVGPTDRDLLIKWLPAHQHLRDLRVSARVVARITSRSRYSQAVESGNVHIRRRDRDAHFHEAGPGITPATGRCCSVQARHLADLGQPVEIDRQGRGLESAANGERQFAAWQLVRLARD